MVNSILISVNVYICHLKNNIIYSSIYKEEKGFLFLGVGSMVLHGGLVWDVGRWVWLGKISTKPGSLP